MPGAYGPPRLHRILRIIAPLGSCRNCQPPRAPAAAMPQPFFESHREKGGHADYDHPQPGIQGTGALSKGCITSIIIVQRWGALRDLRNEGNGMADRHEGQWPGGSLNRCWPGLARAPVLERRSSGPTHAADWSPGRVTCPTFRCKCGRVAMPTPPCSSAGDAGRPLPHPRRLRCSPWNIRH